MAYADAIKFLHDLGMFGARLGLEIPRRLAALAGDPQAGLRFIHVAGTNGKGSTCAMLESIYRAAGLRVGLFTSPHLVAFSERIQVNRQLIPEADVVRLVDELRLLLKTFSPVEPPTFFEVVTVMALRHFAEQRCDLVIWETGLGGRLDATNIITPLASVITNIGLDHQQWLGDTLEKIAAEKAGIIKPGVPVVTAARAGEGLDVIAATARRLQSPLTAVELDHAHRPPLDALELPLAGEHQRLNAAVALATVRVLARTLPMDDAAMRRGLTSVHWPGRMQWVKTPDGRAYLLDGAHNAAGVAALGVALRARFPGVKPALVLGVLGDKDWQSIGAQLAGISARIVLVPVSSQRSLAPENLLPICRKANVMAPVSVCGNLAEALKQTANEPFVLITGSLYLVGEAMELLHLATVPPAGERELNEWSGVRR